MNRTSESCGIAFKEWASVCDALLAGRQTIILRKGGISEGQAPGTFVPEYSEFWLYPTWVHQAEQGVRETPAAPPSRSPAMEPFPSRPWSASIFWAISTTSNDFRRSKTITS